MHSKKSIWGTRVGLKTFKNFKVPRSVVRSPHATKANIRMVVNANKKRARRLNYSLVLGFEE